MGKKVEYQGDSKDAAPIRINFKNPISITDIGTAEMNCGIEYMIGEEVGQGHITLYSHSAQRALAFKNEIGLLADPQRTFRYVEVGFFPYDGLPTTKRAEAKLFIGGEEK